MPSEMILIPSVNQSFIGKTPEQVRSGDRHVL
jgi:hypothetical protein